MVAEAARFVNRIERYLKDQKNVKRNHHRNTRRSAGRRNGFSLLIPALALLGLAVLMPTRAGVIFYLQG